MPLVNYGSSDEDSDGEDDNIDDGLNNNQNNNKLDKKVKSSSDVSAEEITSNIFSRLPEPKVVSSQSVQSSSLSDIVINKSSSGPIKISIPSLKNFYEDDSEEEKKSKRFKGSTVGTGLSSILPKPKNSNITKTSSFIPQSLLRPKAKPSSVGKPNLPKSKKEEDSNEKNINFFFNEEEDKIDDMISKDIYLSDIEFGPKPDSNPITSTSISAQSSDNTTINDITYKKLIASKFGEEAPEDINIVDIDVSKHLSESKDWLKTISEEKEEEYSGVQPSSTARRKHQITFLALQAKQREVELKNEWARSRSTKSMSRAKYGF